MKKWISLFAVVFAVALPAPAEVIWDEEAEDGVDISPIGPIRAGHLEINPIMSFRMSGGAAVYQVGGSFVMGNRLYNRTNRRQVVGVDNARIGGTTANVSVNQGFGSSLTGFYRFNLPCEVSKQTYPHLEVFAGRDFGWGNLSEVGGGLGVRKFVSRTTALTSQCSYVVLFADSGANLKRHVISAGVTVFAN